MHLFTLHRQRSLQAALVFIAGLLLLGGCSRLSPDPDADVIIVGAGIAGLSAALEARAYGATVLLIDANSVGGGHAVKAGGFALVDTELQRRKGIQDSPDLARADLARWGDDPDPYWTRRYAEESGTEVYDWLTAQGVEFRMVLDTPEDSVPRFHFTAGTAVNAVVPLMRQAFADPGIHVVLNQRVKALTRLDGQITGVVAVDERSGDKTRYRAASVVLATGGFQNNLDMVRENWPSKNPPAKILKGAGHFATGDGYDLAAWAGADMQRMTNQVTFYTGVPNPRDPTATSGFFAQNPAAIWLDNNGRRFVNESANSKVIEAAASALQPTGFWMVFDAPGSRRFSMRDSPWLDGESIRAEFLDNPEITRKADNISALAQATGLSKHSLVASVQVWNRMLATGTDYQFGRFTPDVKPRGIKPLSRGPYYAVKVYPMTRKSMGGPAINPVGQVLDQAGTPIAGLYAAGELTGVAGINGSHGGSGTFLGPSVLTGRIAGKQAALSSGLGTPLQASAPASIAGDTPNYELPGYWHYDAVHRTASERAYVCDQCHSDQFPMARPVQASVKLAQLNTCTNCH